MTNFRPVVRTTQGGTIKQHAELDWVYYASVSVNGVWYSTTTRTLEEAESWVAATRAEHQQPRKPYPPNRRKRKYNNDTTQSYDWYYNDYIY